MNILSIVFVLTVALNICLGFILQMSKVQVFPQDSVVLPCNSSGFLKEELHWEAMGKDVVSLHGGNITVSQGFEDRVFLVDPDLSEDFSLVLKDVMFNDGGVYRCLWKGQKTICSVHVHVLKPLVFPVFAVVGEEVTLKCFGHISKNQAWEDLNIQWFKDHREVIRLTSGKTDVNVENSSMSLPSREDLSRGIFSLTIRSVRDLDQGVYHCWYSTADYEEPRSGHPESHTLTVLAVSSEVSPTTDSILSVSDGSHTHISRSGSTLTAVANTPRESSSPVSTQTYVKRNQTESISRASSQTSAEIAKVTSTTDSIPIVSDSSHTHTSRSVSTLTAVASTESELSRPVSTHAYVKRSETEPISTAYAQTYGETAEGRYGHLKIPLDKKIPWIVIRLISGVLLITAGVLVLLMLFIRN
nr:uncharacterized protein LOC129445117 [Misgurnus anguillicaudatus]